MYKTGQMKQDFTHDLKFSPRYSTVLAI